MHDPQEAIPRKRSWWRRVLDATIAGLAAPYLPVLEDVEPSVEVRGHREDQDGERGFSQDWLHWPYRG